jgi:F0F1-type ATP synthase assembly protein I
MSAFLLGLFIGFIAGVLVYRNNAAKAEAIKANAAAEYDADKAKAKSLLDALKGKLK